MIKHLTLLLLIGLAWGQNPCEDSRYTELKGKSLDEISEKEYLEFLNLKNECLSYEEKQIANNQEGVASYWEEKEKRKALKNTDFKSIKYPCEDPIYLEIKVKSREEVTDEEYQYFLSMQSECVDWVQRPGSVIPEIYDYSAARKKINTELAESLGISLEELKQLNKSGTLDSYIEERWKRTKERQNERKKSYRRNNRYTKRNRQYDDNDNSSSFWLDVASELIGVLEEPKPSHLPTYIDKSSINESKEKIINNNIKNCCSNSLTRRYSGSFKRNGKTIYKYKCSMGHEIWK